MNRDARARDDYAVFFAVTIVCALLGIAPAHSADRLDTSNLSTEGNISFSSGQVLSCPKGPFRGKEQERTACYPPTPKFIAANPGKRYEMDCRRMRCHEDDLCMSDCVEVSK